MDIVSASLLAHFLLYKYTALFFITVVEGPLITMVAGYLASQGMINFAWAYVLIVIADLLGDSMYYGLGYWSRLRIVTRFSRFAKVSIPTAKKMESLFQKHAVRTMLIAKLTHAAGMPFLVGAGLAKIDFKKFLLANAIATFPKSLTFLLIGYYYGEATVSISRYLEYSTWIAVILMAVTVFVYILVGRIMYKKMLKNKLLTANGDGKLKK
jgi:membrane protein DedA with SNARE-associated domain